MEAATVRHDASESEERLAELGAARGRRAQRGRELLRAYHERDDLEARAALIEQYLPLVRALAARYARGADQLEDLIQVGSIGLIKAIDRFELDRGVELTTYATPTITGEIRRHFRDKGWSVRVPRGLQELNLRLSQLIEVLSADLHRSPTIAELAEAAGVSEEEVLEALESNDAYLTVSLSAPGLGDDGDVPDRLETLGEIDPGFEAGEDRVLLTPALHVLDDRERRILDLRFYGGLTQSQIALELGISQMHVSRLIRSALEKLRAQIPGASDDLAAA
jgi:RNA polymerase sigma-B factor